jgi:hypothetical protein
MSTDPCSYKNANATKAGCIATGGKPNLSDPCNILNPTASPSGCTAATAGNAIANSGLPTWLKVVIFFIGFLVLIGGFYMYTQFMTPTMGGRRRGISLKRILGL